VQRTRFRLCPVRSPLTKGISFDFFSSPYLDVSVRVVTSTCCARNSKEHKWSFRPTPINIGGVEKSGVKCFYKTFVFQIPRLVPMIIGTSLGMTNTALNFRVQHAVPRLASGWITPFGHRRINASWQLPDDYRGLVRPSSAQSPKAFTVCLSEKHYIFCNLAKKHQSNNAQMPKSCLRKLGFYWSVLTKRQRSTDAVLFTFQRAKELVFRLLAY
jgi:hypothetical protein